MNNIKQALTVSALTNYIKHKLTTDHHLLNIYIKGEISNYKKHYSGHLYFSLKDDNSVISCIMFSTLANKLSFSLKEGDKVLIQAKINLYEPSGSYNLNIQKMEKEGIGDLYQKYEELKKHLNELGYFNDEHKKQIPQYPKAIGVVTSNTGAVIQDIKNTVSRRYPLAKIILYPCVVQGEKAKDSIAKQIEKANDDNLCDVLIVGRGGGSIEDLWAFNEIEVINAIFKSNIPIISAIGHQTDTTISDYVSDKRAATPTAAAELATPDLYELEKRLFETIEYLKNLINNKFDDKKQKLIIATTHLQKNDPKLKFENYKTKLQTLKQQITSLYKVNLKNIYYNVETLKKSLISPRAKLSLHNQHLINLHKNLMLNYKNNLINSYNRYEQYLLKLEGLNPLGYMKKGFGLIQKNEKIINSTKELKKDDELDITLSDGQIKAKIIKIKGNEND